MGTTRLSGSFFATVFGRIGPTMEQRGSADHRRRLVTRASGRTVEIGAGYGATFSAYPPAVTGVLALEPNPGLRAAARHAAARAPVPVTVVGDTAEHIPVDDRSVDTVVSSLVLCSVDSQPLVLEELRRVLRPQGRLLYYGHVRSINRATGALEDALTPLWTVIAGGCHLNRPTQDVIEEAGFRIVHSDRFPFSVLPGAPAVAHVIGIAERI